MWNPLDHPRFRGKFVNKNKTAQPSPLPDDDNVDDLLDIFSDPEKRRRLEEEKDRMWQLAKHQPARMAERTGYTSLELWAERELKRRMEEAGKKYLSKDDQDDQDV